MTDIIDLFAGPGGWSQGTKELGLSEVGVEFNAEACATARANGHPRVLADVTSLDPTTLAREHHWNGRGLIASPPCQAFSMSGKRGGKLDQQHCHELADRMAAGDDDFGAIEWADERSHLVCQPVRWVRELRPEWVALEEVPAVLPLWEHFGRIFASWGYSVATGVLHTEQYGLPQTRRRAILVASRIGEATLPVPTHSRYHTSNPARLDAGVLPWVSMAEAIGAGFTDRPAPTVSGGGSRTGGAEPFANKRLRQQLVDTPGWKDRIPGWTKPNVPRLQVWEAARLQGFPDDYQWAGSASWQYLQVGNAVPPPLAKAVVGGLL